MPTQLGRNPRSLMIRRPRGGTQLSIQGKVDGSALSRGWPLSLAWGCSLFHRRPRVREHRLLRRHTDDDDDPRMPCHPARGWRADCTASWSVGGQSHTGTINVDHDYPPSSSLDVRAFAGVAYASPPCIVFSRTCFRSSYMLIAIGAIAVCAVVSIVWRRWWRRPTDRPWEKRTVADMSRFTDQV
jgi:hypothetical protein